MVRAVREQRDKQASSLPVPMVLQSAHDQRVAAALEDIPQPLNEVVSHARVGSSGPEIRADMRRRAREGASMQGGEGVSSVVRGGSTIFTVKPKLLTMGDLVVENQSKRRSCSTITTHGSRTRGRE
eukprot:jgi/Mesvir1/3129/Mv16302-RA.1